MVWTAEYRAETSAEPAEIWRLSGPSAETLGPQLGPEISGDFPQVLAELVARAERA